MITGISVDAIARRLEPLFATGKPIRVGVNKRGTILTIIEDGSEQSVHLNGAKGSKQVWNAVRRAVPYGYTSLDSDSNNTGTVYQTFVPSDQG